MYKLIKKVKPYLLFYKSEDYRRKYMCIYIYKMSI